jgi:outer membrane protein assembly factor BamE
MKKCVTLALLVSASVLLHGCSALDYKSGTPVSSQQLAQFQKGKTTQQQVIGAIGQPANKSEVSGKEIWTYPYTKIAALPFAPNVNESTVFEWSSKGVLLDVYKSGAAKGQSGNALLDAAGM